MSDVAIAAAARLAGRPGRVLLHSASDDDGLGGGSFVASDPIELLEIRDGVAVIHRGDGEAAVSGDPLDAIEAFCARHGADLRARGGGGVPVPRVIGWLGYDLGRSIERLGPGPGHTLGHRDAWLAAYPAVARIDATGEIDVVGPEPAARRALEARLAGAARPPSSPPKLGTLVADDDAERYHRQVQRILALIRAGDVYQVNLARRHSAPIQASGDALAIYAALAAASPAPYGALLEDPTMTVISGSPERFLTRRPGSPRIETRPIKGTRPRRDEPADRARAAELAEAVKDSAEHLMIVDLERNDLGRVATVGSVAVDRLGYVVALPALYHRVSQVSAELRPQVGLAELLRATFPGGSITGAPKVRAMQIIDELEAVRRGPYCGAVGYFGEDGALDLAIAIRIAVVTPRELSVFVGGGIVADSEPAAELAETEDKVRGWRRALAAVSAAHRPDP